MAGFGAGVYVGALLPRGIIDLQSMTLQSQLRLLDDLDAAKTRYADAFVAVAKYAASLEYGFLDGDERIVVNSGAVPPGRDAAHGALARKAQAAIGRLLAEGGVRP